MRLAQLRQHELIQARRLFPVNQFNIIASDKISIDRRLEDVRSADCRALSYSPASLPPTSIIIVGNTFTISEIIHIPKVFHNEAWSTLLRTVHRCHTVHYLLQQLTVVIMSSALNTAPAGLVREFLLVDDASDRAFLGAELEAELARLPVPATVVRATNRVGLIQVSLKTTDKKELKIFYVGQARLLGARRATAPVLTFLDAHCECTAGWLEPLLDRIRQSPTSVVCPVIDIINDDTFQAGYIYVYCIVINVFRL